MNGRLAGKTCFVTGAAQGIGRSVATTFASEGARVVAVDLRFHDQLSDEMRCITLDVTDEDALVRVAADLGPIDVLVNCVGYVATGSVLESPLAEFDRSMAINLRSALLTTRAFLPGMRERREGSIINIASVVSSVKAAPGRCAYATSKAAVIGLTMAVARDFIGEGIRCNAISPGTVESPSLHERFAATGDPDAAHAAFVARQPMGRLGQPNEIAAAAVMLASDEAPFMTGANLIIDGGMSL